MKKVIALLLTAALTMSLMACGSNNTQEQPTAAPAEEETEAPAEELETEAAEESGEVTTVTEGVLIMGTNAAFPPYEFYEDDEIVGIDAEIAAAIAEKLGLTLQIEDMAFESLVTAVQTGKIDVALAGMTVTEERLENVNFTTSYATGVQVIIVPEDSDITSVDDLDGKLIGTQAGTTGYLYCSDDYGDDMVTPYDNGAMAVQALTQGKVDCVVIDEQPAIAFVAANEGLKILETEYVIEDYAIAVSKDNQALTDAMDAAIKELIADGTVQSILDKYIAAE